jgi:hypothetical protein
MKPESDANNPSVVVTLVHGTIPRIGPFSLFGEPTWIASGSKFRSELTKQLGVDVRFESFSWSGNNSHSARITAARGLATTLQHQIQRHPTSKHYVVAHSHGGNVALYATGLLTEVERRAIRGVVTLGTPFLHSHKRDVRWIRANLKANAIAGLLAWFLMLIPFFWTEPSSGLGWALQAALPIAMICFGAYVLASLGRYKVSAWEDTAAFYEQQLSSLPPPHSSVLCIQANRDEAALWVRGIEWMSNTFFADRVLDKTLPIIGLWRAAYDFIPGQPIGGALRLLDLLIPGAGLVALVWVLPATGLLLLAWCASVLALFLIALVVVGTLFTTSAPWGFGQSILMPWVIRVWIENKPMSSLYDVERERTAIELISLNLSLNSSSPIESNADRLGDWVDMSTQEFTCPRFSFHHSYLCADNAAIFAIAGWMSVSPNERKAAQHQAGTQDEDPLTANCEG